MCKPCDKRIHGSNENSNHLVLDAPKKKLGMTYLCTYLLTTSSIHTYLVINKAIGLQLYYSNCLADLLVKCLFDVGSKIHLNFLAIKIWSLLKISLSIIQSLIRLIDKIFSLFHYLHFLTQYLEIKKIPLFHI